VTTKTIPRHARTLARQRGAPSPNADKLPSPAVPGTALPQPADGQVRTDPLAGPVAITEWAVLGDAIRRPAVWCEMPGCISWHDHPAALGQADIRARALAAGWCHDAVGRLVCPSCQQRNPDLWLTHRLARHPGWPAPRRMDSGVRSGPGLRRRPGPVAAMAASAGRAGRRRQRLEHSATRPCPQCGRPPAPHRPGRSQPARRSHVSSAPPVTAPRRGAPPKDRYACKRG